MQPAADERERSDEHLEQDPYRISSTLHGVGVLLSLAALVLQGVDSPGVGLPIAVGLLVALGLVGSPPASAPPQVLRVVRGSVLHGGMRQGALIKSAFAIALLYAGSHAVLFGDGSLVLPRLFLGLALGLSGIGTELDARWIGRRIDATAGPARTSE